MQEFEQASQHPRQVLPADSDTHLLLTNITQVPHLEMRNTCAHNCNLVKKEILSCFPTLFLI
jgi:hypothetical protein